MARLRLGRTLSLLGLAACVLLCAGCPPDYGETPFSCTSKSPACPEGYVCLSGVCHREGVKPPPFDARGDKPWQPPSDSRSDGGPFDLSGPLDHYTGMEPIATVPDLPAGLSCRQINDCYGTCNKNDQPCYDACFAKGSPDGKAKMAAMENCEDQAMQNACYNACYYRSQQACWNCLDYVCASPIAACFPA
jgi:hypothetical protein